MILPLLASLMFAGGASAQPVNLAPENCPPDACDPSFGCDPGPFLVYFDFDSVAIRPDAQQVLDAIVAGFGGDGPCQASAFFVSGHTDRAGSESYNEELSRERAIAVARALREGGFAVETQGWGEARPLERTSDGERNQQNRRAEISKSR